MTQGQGSRWINYEPRIIGELLAENKAQLIKLLQMVDIDIINLKHKTIIESGNSTGTNHKTRDAFFKDLELSKLEIKTYHKSSPKVAFDFITEESGGTKRLFFLMLTILDVVKNNKVLLVDELEDGPTLADKETLIYLFFSFSGKRLKYHHHQYV